MYKYLVIISILISTSSCNIKTNVETEDKQRINKVCDQFMSSFVEGNYMYSIELLRRNTVIDHASIDTLSKQVIEKITTITPSYGKIISFEFVVDKKINNTLSKRYYLLKFEKYYLKFEFILYNNQKNWTITSFMFDEEVDSLF